MALWSKCSTVTLCTVLPYQVLNAHTHYAKWHLCNSEIMIPNDQIWYLKQVKDEPPCNPSTVFRVRVRALFEWQNRSKVKVAFVFALDAFAFALCINGPWETKMHGYPKRHIFVILKHWISWESVTRVKSMGTNYLFKMWSNGRVDCNMVFQ